MKKNLLVFSLLLTTVFANAQLSGYYQQGFEDAKFPPAGWDRNSVKGDNQWIRINTFSHTGKACAYDSYNTPKGINYLITPQFTAASTDSISFWLAAAALGFTDSLYVQVSTTNKAPGSFTTIATFADGDNYPSPAQTWGRFALSLAAYAGQNIYIAFKHVDYDGDGIVLDDVALGTAPPDAAAVSIDVPTPSPSGTTISPQATFQNLGSQPATFNVTLTTTSYTSTKTITNLPSQNSQQVTFDPWTIPAGTNTYTLTAYSTLAGDVNHSNDTVTKSITTATGFANSGWFISKNSPLPAFGDAVATYTTGVAPNDTTYIFQLGGAGNVNLDGARKYNTRTKKWSSIARLPRTVYQASAFTYNGKIFVLGGYHPNATEQGFHAINTVSIYDIASDTWTEGAPMPVGVGDYAGLQYQDSLMYVISGFNGQKDVNKVQIYNASTDTWESGTDFGGFKSAGLRGGVSGNKIVVVGGYSREKGHSLSQAVVGVIDPSDPTNITWTKVADYAGGKASRLAATGVKNGAKPYVYFTGGDPNGQGVKTLAGTWAYDVNANQWLLGPNKPTAVSNLNNFAPFVLNDTVYIASVGGYDGTSIQTDNEWLILGPTSQVLPIHLISFTATLQNNKTTLLSWKVAEDGTGGYYTIQKSADGTHFTDMASNINAGRIATTVSYSSQDLLPFKGYTYYRIKIVNADGSMSYSAIRPVNNLFAGNVTIAASVYPNPSHGPVNVFIQNNNSNAVTVGIVISDIAGRKIAIDNKTISTSLNLTYNLKAGTYVIDMISADGSFKQSQKLIVQ